MNAKHLRPTATSRKLSRAITIPVVLVAALAVGTPAFAGKPSSGATSGVTCAVNPSTATVGGSYVLNVAGMAAGTIVNEMVTDAAGTTTVWQLKADASGTTSVTGYAYHAGTSNVKVQKSVRRGWTTLATCAFNVV